MQIPPPSNGIFSRVLNSSASTRLTRRKLLAAGVATAGATLAFPAILRGASRKRKLVMIAGKPSHPPGMHEFNAGVTLLSGLLKQVPDLEVSTHNQGWVSDEKAFEGADAILIYADGRDKHPIEQADHKATIAKLMAAGVSLMCAHYAVEVDPDVAGKEMQSWIGGHYENMYSVNPLWQPKYETFPDHPIARGVKPFSILDEWYFNIRFRPNMEGVTSILQAKPSDQVRAGPYVSPKGPYPHIQAASGRTETMMWAVERPDGGRGVGFTGGHFHTNWGVADFRKVVLNALLWISKLEVPAGGLETKVPEGELLKNLDDKPQPKAKKKE